MRYYKKAFLLMLIFLTTGCGIQYINNLKRYNQPSLNVNKKIAILPFSIYEPNNSPYHIWILNREIDVTLKKVLTDAGLTVTPQKDTIDVLLKERLIYGSFNTLKTGQFRSIDYLRRELQSSWSPEMKSVIKSIFKENEANLLTISQFPDISLNKMDKTQIQNIKKALKVDYILRGVLVELSISQNETFYPIKSSYIPIYYHIGKRWFSGLIDTQKYEYIESPCLVKNGFSNLVELFPEGLDIGLKEGTRYEGLVYKPALILIMTLHDAYSGEIIWSGGNKGYVIPSYNYLESDKEMVLEGLEKMIKELSKDFVEFLTDTSPSNRYIRYTEKSYKLLNQRRWNEAYLWASLAIAINPQLPDAYINRAWAYIEKGEIQKAIIDCNTALRIAPNNPLAYNNRAYAYEKMGMIDSAKKDYKTACEIGLALGCENLERLKKGGK